MTKNLNAYALAHGYQIIKTPKCVNLPFIGYIWLPTWLTYEPEYVSKKRSRYTLDGLIWKLKMKRDRKRRKRIIERNRAALALKINQLNN